MWGTTDLYSDHEDNDEDDDHADDAVSGLEDGFMPKPPSPSALNTEGTRTPLSMGTVTPTQIEAEKEEVDDEDDDGIFVENTMIPITMMMWLSQSLREVCGLRIPTDWMN